MSLVNIKCYADITNFHSHTECNFDIGPGLRCQINSCWANIRASTVFLFLCTERRVTFGVIFVWLWHKLFLVGQSCTFTSSGLTFSHSAKHGGFSHRLGFRRGCRKSRFGNKMAYSYTRHDPPHPPGPQAEARGIQLGCSFWMRCRDSPCNPCRLL